MNHQMNPETILVLGLLALVAIAGIVDLLFGSGEWAKLVAMAASGGLFGYGVVVSWNQTKNKNNQGDPS